MVNDMTTGDPIRKILRFFVPVLLGNLLQQLYSMADSVIVSRFIGVDAFAGVTATGSFNFLILGLALGTCSGFAIPVSQEFGAGNHALMRRCFANSIFSSAVFSAALAVLTAYFTPQILALVGTPKDILPYSSAYMRIIFAGIPATMAYNLMSGVLRAVGDGKTPLYMLVFSCLLNIALDILFVLPLNMGVAGAALATVISQLISGALCCFVIFRKFDILKIRADEWRFDWQICRRLLGMGLPMGLQFSITAIGSVILQKSVNALGSAAVAAIGAGAKVQFIFTSPIEATGVTMATYCGQNIGARRIDRVRAGVRKITVAFAGFSALAFGLQLLLGRTILTLFIDPAETLILENAVRYMNTVMGFIFLLAIVLIYRNAIQGLGYSRVSMFAGIMEMIGRALVALLFVPAFGFPGACFANPIAWIAADLLLVPLYLRIVKKFEISYGIKED